MEHNELANTEGNTQTNIHEEGKGETNQGQTVRK